MFIVTTTSSLGLYRLVLLRNENLEVRRALGARIYRSACEDECRAGRDDFLCLIQERSCQAAFLRRQKNILARFAFARGCHFRPPEVSSLIPSLNRAKD